MMPVRFTSPCLLLATIALSMAATTTALADRNATATSENGIDENCRKHSEQLLDDLAAGEYARSGRAFNQTMKQALPADKLQAAWESLLPQFGRPTQRADPKGMHKDGLAVIYTPLRFERATLISQVACDSDGRIAGFYVVPEMPKQAPAQKAQEPVKF